MKPGCYPEDIFGKKFLKRCYKSHWSKSVSATIQEAKVGNEAKYKKSIIDNNQIFNAGEKIEIMKQELLETATEAEEALEKVRGIYNNIVATYDQVQPHIKEMVTSIRSAKQGVVFELSSALTLMKDVRKFFIDSDYKEEMERLEAFVKLGERFRELIKDGTFEAVCDASLKLAVGKEG